MYANRLTEYFPHLPLGMLLGLMLSICFRRRPGATLIWVPTMVSYVTVSWLIIKGILRLGGLRGPDAGWGGLEIIYLLPILSVCIAGGFACYFCRPKEYWHPRILITAISFSGAALFYFHWSNGTSVRIQLMDTNGHPVNDVSLEYNNGPRTPGSSNFKFSLRRQQSLGLRIIPSSSLGEALSTWSLRFSSVREDSSKLEVIYSTSRRIGFDQSLIESLTKTLPFTPNITIALILTPEDLIGSEPMRDKIGKLSGQFSHDQAESLSGK